MALSEWEFRLQQAKDVGNRILGQIPSAESAPPPNAFGRGGVTTAPGVPAGLQPVASQTQQGMQTPAAPAAPQPASDQPIALQPAGVKQAVQTIPVGKYGWKGTSESVNGMPTLTFGTPGQDNSGVGSWRPGSAIIPSGLRVNAAPGTSARFVATPGAVGGMQEKTPLEISIENSDRMKSGGLTPGGIQPPKYLTREEGAAMGLGWKGRLNKYNQDMELYGKQIGNTALRDIEQMREAGAGVRSLMQAQTENDKLQAGLGLRTAQTAEATAKAAAEMQLMNAADAFFRAKEGSPEQATAMRNYLMLSKQAGGLSRDNKPIIEKIDTEVAGPGGLPLKSQALTLVDPKAGTFTKLREAEQPTTYDPKFLAEANANADRAKNFGALPKAQQDLIYQQWLAAQRGGK